MNKLLELKILPNRKLTPALTSAAAACISTVTSDGKLIESLKEALILAMDNVIIHGSSERKFDITLSIYTDENILHIDLDDTGLPYDFSSTDEAGKILKTVTSYKVENLGKKGRRQSITCTLNDGAVIPEQENLDTEEALTGVEIKIRDARESDYLNIARSFYREMGFSYFKEAAYTPDAFAALINSGLNHALVAETADGRFAGYHLLTGWDNLPGVYEGAMAITSPLVRKCGAFSKLMDMNNNYFEHTIAHGVQISEAVTVHDITQKTRLKYGYTPCGFSFNCTAPDSFYSSFKNSGYRKTWALSCHVIDHSPKDIYVPAEITHVLDVIYEGEKLPRTYHTEPVPAADKKTEYETRFAYDDVVTVTIRSIGSDHKKTFKNIVYLLKQHQSETCQIYIPVEHPGVVDCYEELKALNFRFAGILPNTDYGDMLIMINPLTNIIDYDSIITIGPFTDMLNMIKQFDPDLKD